MGDWEPHQSFHLPAYAWKQWMSHAWKHLVCWAKSLSKKELLNLHDKHETDFIETSEEDVKGWSKEKLCDYFLRNSLDTINNFLLPLQLDPINEKYQETRKNLETKSFELYKIYHQNHPPSSPSSPSDKWRSHIGAFKISAAFETKSVHQLELKMQSEESQTASTLFFIAIMVTVTIDVLEDMILLHPDCVVDDYTSKLRNDFMELIQVVFRHLKEQTETECGGQSQYYDLLRSKASEMVNSHPYSKLNNYLSDEDKELRVRLHTIRWLALLTTEMVNKRIINQ
jgi:hypothetical protein